MSCYISRFHHYQNEGIITITSASIITAAISFVQVIANNIYIDYW